MPHGHGDYGNDTIYGEDNEVDPNAPNLVEYLDGGPDNDRTYGGNGDDDIAGGSGYDECYGGPGTDVFSECEKMVRTTATKPQLLLWPLRARLSASRGRPRARPFLFLPLLTKCVEYEFSEVWSLEVPRRLAKGRKHGNCASGCTLTVEETATLGGLHDRREYPTQPPPTPSC